MAGCDRRLRLAVSDENGELKSDWALGDFTLYDSGIRLSHPTSPGVASTLYSRRRWTVPNRVQCDSVSGGLAEAIDASSLAGSVTSSADDQGRFIRPAHLI